MPNSVTDRPFAKLRTVPGQHMMHETREDVHQHMRQFASTHQE